MLGAAGVVFGALDAEFDDDRAVKLAVGRARSPASSRISSASEARRGSLLLFWNQQPPPHGGRVVASTRFGAACRAWLAVRPEEVVQAGDGCLVRDG